MGKKRPAPLFILLFAAGVVALLVFPYGPVKSVEVVKPFKLQNEDFDCGPASLKFILDHLQMGVPLSEIRTRTGATEHGTSMLSLKHCAEELGLEARGWFFAKHDVQRIPLPAIVYLNRRHFAVLEEVKDKHVVVVDPAQGRLRMALSTFFEQWRGETLVLSPKKGGEKQ